MLGGGNWPAGGEIDILENVGKAQHPVRNRPRPGLLRRHRHRRQPEHRGAARRRLHQYRVDWSPNLIIWYLDGSEYFRVTPSSLRGNPGSSTTRSS